MKFGSFHESFTTLFTIIGFCFNFEISLHQLFHCLYFLLHFNIMDRFHYTLYTFDNDNFEQHVFSSIQRFKLMERCVNFFEISLYIPKFQNVKLLCNIFMAYLVNLQHFFLIEKSTMIIILVFLIKRSHFCNIFTYFQNQIMWQACLSLTENFFFNSFFYLRTKTHF